MEKTATLNLNVNPTVKAPNLINMDLMTSDELHAKLQRGYDDIEVGKVQNAAGAFAKFIECDGTV